ncbi:MAG: hydrogenase maturation nickel metallochaperone HypA [Nitrospinaceae bacterium]|jgi:hydrogenase nickel incorporation protein HypA/HybF|nr:MAG: hydrogenase maturation nickel metallochaperone HypA [Nitrospinaceae bacterium]
MHELGITENIVAIVRDHARGQPVTRVSVEIGRLAAVSAEALHFCFDACTRGTELENARLEIIDVPGARTCRDCGRETNADHLPAPCPCGSWNTLTTRGMDLRVKEMEIA